MAAAATANSALSAPVTSLRGVGPALAEKLARLGLSCVEDLLFALPLRFEDRTSVTAIGGLLPGTRAQVCGEIMLSDVVFRGRRALLCRISDHTGQLTMRLFHFSKAQQLGLTVGKQVLLYGDVRAGQMGVEMVHPEYKILKSGESPALESSLTPVYPTTEGVSQHRLRSLVATAIALLKREAPAELLPRAMLDKLSLPPLPDAILHLHRPPAGMNHEVLMDGQNPAIRRLALEELLAHHLSLRRLRDRQRANAAPAMARGSQLVRDFEAGLPYSLTAAQVRVRDEIALDLSGSEAMQRLVQGDVGSGKTVVACLAALQAIAAGFQVALMAPTEILAEQHRSSFTQWLKPYELDVAILKSRQPAALRRSTLSAIRDGALPLVIGTHALFQDTVEFQNLGLVIIDEQHRFGVEQRLALTRKAANGMQAHQLVMTATPIPRTLAMTAYADLDTSVIDELPPGRTPVQTAVIPEARRDELIDKVSAACKEGRQAYWVCPLIEISDVLDAEAAEHRYEQLTDALPDVTIGLIHGRMKTAEKESVMSAFKDGSLALLVATTVIEVGVDVPNASLMVIENAERLGLSQLHQLRGRVGRGAAESSCLLLYKGPLSQMAKSRLSVMRETNDGFIVAEKDLELRGPGEVLGTRQTGAMQFRVANLARDKALLDDVVEAAHVLRRGPPANIEAIVDRWLGGAQRFAEV